MSFRTPSDRQIFSQARWAVQAVRARQGPTRPGREASGTRAHNGPFLPSLIETVECGIFKQLYIHRLQDERRLPKDEVRRAINA